MKRMMKNTEKKDDISFTVRTLMENEYQRGYRDGNCAGYLKGYEEGCERTRQVVEKELIRRAKI